MRPNLNARVFVALAALAGCTPKVLETRLVSDTNDTSGGYEVQTLLRDITGIITVDLLYAGFPNAAPEAAPTLPQDLDASAHAQPMERMAQPPNTAGDRYHGWIGGYPMGTRVFYAVKACNRLSQCHLDPPAWPQEAYSFVVGKLPSSPQVTSVEPGRGPTSGGVRVVVHGEDFRPGMVTSLDGVPCTVTEVVATDLAYCILPEGNPGLADVTVKNPDGAHATLRDGFFYYQAPRVISVTPNSGPTAGGTAVLVAGEFFVPGARVTFEGRHARYVTVVSDTLITCETPPGNAGPADVAVLHPEGGQGMLPHGYRYIPPPVVDGVNPGEGPDFGGQTVEITGDHFVTGATITVGGQPCTNVVYLSATRLTCVVAPGTPGAADVTVRNPDNQQGTLLGGYYYNGPPVVLLVDPPNGPLAAGADAYVFGAGFLPGMTVTFDGVPATVLNATGRDRVHVTVPGASPPVTPVPANGERAVVVAVQNPAPDGRASHLDNAYTYLWPPEPQNVTPGRGPTTGGTSVTVTGRFFKTIRGSDFVVNFDGHAAIQVTVVSEQEIHAVTPAGDPGPADVAVQNHPLSVGVGAGLYVYVAPPRVDSVTPPDGPVFGGDLVTVRGAFFQPGCAVTLNGAACTGVTVAADGLSLTCTTPPGERGPANVTVTNPDTMQGTLPNGYTYVSISVQPPGGFEVGFTRTTIRAAGLQAGVQVFFGNTPATLVQVTSSREVVVQSPAHTLGPVAVRFVNPDGTSDTAPAAFVYRTLRNANTPGVMPIERAVGNDGEAGDWDGDGDVDVVVANGDVNGAQESVIYVNQLKETGHLAFTRVGMGYTSIANQVSLGDVTGDGKPDLLVASDEGTKLFRNTGPGTFVDLAMPSAGDGAFEAVIADFNADGIKDVFILNIGCSNQADNPNCDPSQVGRDNLFINAGNGTFSDHSNLIPHDSQLVHDHKLELTDLDGNGLPDLIIVVDNKNYAGRFGSPRHRILLNFYPNAFEERDPPELLGIVGDIYGIAVGDLNGDGRMDLALPSYRPSAIGRLGNAGTPGSTIVLRGLGGVDFVRDDAALFSVPLNEPSINTQMADLDGDGDLEVMVCNFDGVSRIFVNKGDGTFAPAVTALPQAQLFTTDMVVGDFDLDGDLDVMMINQGQDVLLLAGP